MRAAHLIRICVLLLVVGVGFSFLRRHAVAPPATTNLTSSLLPARPAPPPPPPGPSLESASQRAAYRLAFERRASSVPAKAGLACIQEALGGAKVLAAVTSLRVIANTKPAANPKSPVAATREIGLMLPDQYRQSDIDKDESANARRLRFVREILMRLPRELAGVELLQRASQDAGQERLAIDAFGPDGLGLDVTLLADPGTCMPVALEYRQPSSTTGASDAYRVDLSQYRRFSGVLFPTVLKILKNGDPWQEEHDSDVEVNPRFDLGYFRQ